MTTTRLEEAMALVSWIRGMCSDEEPYPAIDEKLAEVDDLLADLVTSLREQANA